MSTVDVVLVVPPLFPCELASIACGILKESLRRQGLTCKVLYANNIYAQIIGHDLYNRITRGGYGAGHIGERVFASTAHDGISPSFGAPPDASSCGLEISAADLGFGAAEAACRPFVEEVVCQIGQLRPRIVGFSSILQQINPSIAIAKALKETYPEIICVIGGSNCSGEMGEEIAVSISSFDFIFRGEADLFFAKFCHDYLEHGGKPLHRLIDCPPLLDLDMVPAPDYSDYFEQVNYRPDNEEIALVFESSRGCWWGQKNQCTFCGLHSSTIRYRTKSPNKVIEELHNLRRKYPVHWFFAADSIFPDTYFKDFLPALIASGFKEKISYQFKANIDYEQLNMIRDAGMVYISCGFESLSTRLLRLMGKGCTAASNIRILRDFRELGIDTIWNILIHIPDDRASDYETMTRFLPLLQHLNPPGIVPIFIQRFSKYFNNPEAYGIQNIRPAKGYERMFPASADIFRLAYHFDAEYPSESMADPEILNPFKRLVARWRERYFGKARPELSMSRFKTGGWLVRDTRDCAVQSETLIDEEDHALLYCYRLPRSIDADDDACRLERLIERGYMVKVDDKILCLVCEKK